MNGDAQERDKEVLRRMLSQNVIYKYLGKRADIVRKAVDVMLRESTPKKEEMKIVDVASMAVLDVVVYWPLDQYLRDLALSFSRVLREWASKYGCEPLRVRADAIERIVMQHLTILDAIAVLRKVLRRVEPLASYMPPSFRLARHYLETILARYQRGEPINIYEEQKKIKEENNQSTRETPICPEDGS